MPLTTVNAQTISPATATTIVLVLHTFPFFMKNNALKREQMRDNAAKNIVIIFLLWPFLMTDTYNTRKLKNRETLINVIVSPKNTLINKTKNRFSAV